MTKMDHRDHLKAMKCHFKDIMKDTVRTMDNARCEIEESIVNHDLLPGKSVYDNGESIVVKVVIPGIKKEDLNLNITESLLTIEASFKLENHIKGSLVSFEDKQIGTIKRKISLPEKVLPQEAAAKLENGILRVEIPKVEKEEQFKVKIE